MATFFLAEMVASPDQSVTVLFGTGAFRSWRVTICTDRSLAGVFTERSGWRRRVTAGVDFLPPQLMLCRAYS